MPDHQDHLETTIRTQLVDLMPIEHAPAHLRFAFHDAGTYDASTHTGGAHGTIRLTEQLRRCGNTGWGHACLELLDEVKADHPEVSWADMIMIGGSGGVLRCGGPETNLGLGRVDWDVPAPGNRLPGGFEGAGMLKRMFARMGLSMRDLVVLAGAHTLGFTQRRAMTADPWVFSNSYFRQLV